MALVISSSYGGNVDSIGAFDSGSNSIFHYEFPLWCDLVDLVDIFCSFSSDGIFKELLNFKPKC